MKQIQSYWRSTARAGSAAAMFAFLTFPTALAAPPEGKGGGKGGNDEESPSVPFVYQVTWFETETSGDVLYLRDVAPDGTVVGAIRPGGVYDDQIAFVSFPDVPDGSLLDVQEMLHTAEVIPATWRATYAFRICNHLLIGVDIYDDAGGLYSGALQLNSDRTFGSFSLFAAPAGLDAILMDASETGDFLIATGDLTDGFGTGIRTRSTVDLHVWTPLVKTSFELASNVPPGETTNEGWWDRSKISNYPAAIYPVRDSVDPSIVRHGFVDYSVNLSPTQLPNSETSVAVGDVGADGTVVATISGAQIRRNKVEPNSIARWRPGDSDWEILFEGDYSLINGNGEIASGKSFGSISVFQDRFDGVISVNDMIDPSQESGWDASGRHRLLALSNIAPGSPGGVILGQELDGSYRHFVLTPVTP